MLAINENAFYPVRNIFVGFYFFPFTFPLFFVPENASKMPESSYETKALCWNIYCRQMTSCPVAFYHLPFASSCFLFSAGDPGVVQGSCPNRKESKPLNSKGTSLFLMNYFPTYPVQSDACKEHSTPLAEMVGTCFKAAGHVMPNFVAVNFYMVTQFRESVIFIQIFCSRMWNLFVFKCPSYG